MSKKIMTTTKTLTEAEKFFIEAKMKEGMPPEDLAKAIKKDEALVNEFISTLGIKERSQFEKALAKQTVGKKAGPTIMTQAASQAGDAVPRVNVPHKYSNCITKIRNE